MIKARKWQVLTLVTFLVGCVSTSDCLSQSKGITCSDTTTFAAPSEDTLLQQMRWASYTRTTMGGRTPDKTDIRPVPAAIAGGLFTSAVIGLHVYQANAWWKDDRGPFHFVDDWGENLQNDKFGHFFGAYFISYLNREALLQSGFSDRSAHNLGSLLGLLYQLYVETEDGYAKVWGFSPSDAYADVAGAGYFFLQRYIPVLQNFHEKWTYWPSQFLGTGSIPGQKRTFIDDYQGQSYWWSVDIWNLLPSSAQAWYPQWLQLSAGYIAKKYKTYEQGIDNDLPDTREVYIGLDYSLPNLIPRTSYPFVNWIVQTLDNIHFPAPALRLSPTPKFFLLYPIRLRIANINF